MNESTRRRLLERAGRLIDRFDKSERRRLRAHAVALLFVAAAVALKLIAGSSDTQTSFALMRLAVAGAALVGGLASGFVAMLAALLSARIISDPSWTAAALFAVEAMLVASLIVYVRGRSTQMQGWLAAADAEVRELRTTARQGRIVSETFDDLERASRHHTAIVLGADGRSPTGAPAPGACTSAARSRRSARMPGSCSIRGSSRSISARCSNARGPRDPGVARRSSAVRRHDLRRRGAAARPGQCRRRSVLDGGARSDRSSGGGSARAARGGSAGRAPRRGDARPGAAGEPGAGDRSPPERGPRPRGADDAARPAAQRSARRRHCDRAARRALVRGCCAPTASGPSRQTPRSVRDGRTGRALLIHNDEARVADMSVARWPDGVLSLIAVPLLQNGETHATMEVVYQRGRAPPTSISR